MVGYGFVVLIVVISDGGNQSNGSVSRGGDDVW